MDEPFDPINDALDNIQSDRARDREKGLAALRNALNLYRRSPGLTQSVKSKSIHLACEKLFQAVSSERSTYVRATKSNVKALSASRLESCASAIRLMVEVFVTSMRQKAVQAVVGHITQTLPTADGGFCTPLALEFFKALKVITSYEPHVEHLDHGTWSDLVEFCISGLDIYGEEAESANKSFGALELPVVGSVLRTASTVTTARPSRGTTNNIVELVECLRSLTMASNCPLLQKAPAIITALTEFIGNSFSTTTAHHAAFEAINGCLKVISTHSKKLMLRVISDVLPLVKQLWLRKQQTLRDEMLITLILSRPYLMSLGKQDQSETLLPIIESLLETMSAEYFGSRDKVGGHLTLDQLALNTRHNPLIQVMPMQCSTFSVRRTGRDTEHNWSVVHLLAFFMNWVDSQRTNQINRDGSNEERSAKRPRTSSKLHDLTENLSRVSMQEKMTYSLQIIAFAVEQKSPSIEEWAAISDCLLAKAGHENGDVSSWALLGLANCASRVNEKGIFSDILWLKVWHLSIRLISSNPHSRAACHVLDVLLCTGKVKYEDVADSIDGLMTSFALNGPALLSDSALSMSVTMLEMRSANSPGQSGDASNDRLLEWLFSKWKPSDFENRTYSHQLSRETMAMNFERAFKSFVGQSFIESCEAVQPIRLLNLGAIGQTWLLLWFHKPLTDYLLLSTDELPGVNHSHSDEQETPKMQPITVQTAAHSSIAILRFLLAEAERTMKSWQSIRQNRPTTINSEMINIIFSFCICGIRVAHSLKSSQRERASDVQAKMSELAKDVLEYSAEANDGTIIITLLQVIASFLPNIATSSSAHDLSDSITPFATILDYVAKMLKSRDESFNGAAAEDLMEVDDMEFDAEPKEPKRAGFNRRQDAACCSERSFTASASCYIQFLSSIHNGTTVDIDSNKIPHGFIQHVRALVGEEFISCRPLVRMLLGSKLQLSANDAGDLLGHVHETLLDPYEWNRCEVALGLCLDIMNCTVPMWTDASQSSISDIGAALYEWFMEIALKNEILSTASQIEITNLLYKLLDVAPTYTENSSKPSIRTRLFQILKNGNLIVQFHISRFLVEVFNSFILSQHEMIFDDIFDSLPTELEHQEGINVRMFVFTQIGSAWKNLLRRCLFHILETAGLVPDSAAHARYCVKQIATSLRLSDPRCMFRLFSPQLLHTWLERHPLKSIAYTIFAYQSLREMLHDAKAQFLSQLLMIGSAEKLNDFETELGSSVKEVLMESFGQAVAYGMAKDLSMHGLEGNNSHVTEARIRDCLGKSQYLELLASELPAIVGHLFVRLEHEDQIEKTLSKRPEYAYVAGALQSIKSHGYSTIPHSQSQQPSFKSKLLLDEIDRICRRLSKKSSDIWTSTLVIRAARMLFEDANDAFGPLHACRTIQRLRLLICLAGSTATIGYPLEMLLHGLRPFVTKSQCADDAIGLFEYLMSSGREHLTRIPRFLTGTSILLMLSLRDFLASKPDSTTQSAQHRATLSRAQDFRDWLGLYVESYEPKPDQETSVKRLRDMVSSARRVHGPGGASSNTSESQLLLHLLNDVKERDGMLGETFASECLSLLCKQFSNPPSFREDVVGTDQRSAEYASAIWKSLKIADTSQPYLHWAAAALGRGFGYGGYVNSAIMEETNLDYLRRPLPATKSRRLASASRMFILRSLVDSLWDIHPEVVGMAEKALQQIVSQYKGTDDVLVVECSVPNAVFDDFSSDTYSSSPRRTLQHRDASQCLRNMHMPFPEWIKEVTSALSECAKYDSVLSATVPLLQAVDGLAERLFPFVLHAALVTAPLGVDGSNLRQELSQSFNECLKDRRMTAQRHLRSLINAALYLRTQPKPQERTALERNEWLEFDLTEMASAAYHCKMLKTSLLLFELHQSLTGRSHGRHSTVSKSSLNQDFGLLVPIFRELDEPDSFYGLEQQSDLDYIADRMDYEGDNIQSLLLRGATMDTQLREDQRNHSQHAASIIQSLGKLGLNSITNNIASTQRHGKSDEAVIDTMIASAMKLGQWDIAVPSHILTTKSHVYRTFQAIHGSTNIGNVRRAVNDGLLGLLSNALSAGGTGPATTSSFGALSALTEVSDMLQGEGQAQFSETWGNLLERDQWMENSSVENVSLLLTSRDAFSRILSGDANIQAALNISPIDSRHIEVVVALHSSEINRKLGSLQDSLCSTTYLSSLVSSSAEHMNMTFEASIKKETADILWERGELVPSIKTLQTIKQTPDIDKQTVPVGPAGLLADIAYRVSYAHLEKPDDILSKYLQPALKSLGAKRQGPEAGRVFHEYATYCHKQLENPDSIEELRRSERFMRQRTTELQDLETVLTTNKKDMATRKEVENVKRWLKIDKSENQRLKKLREDFLRSSLEHYLRSLAASDDFNTNVISFLAIWLGNSENETANTPVRDYQGRVPSKKFTPLMNQLASRLQETESEFQAILSEIIMRICQDHPYHGMYHIFAGSMTSGGNDSQARSRKGAASKIAQRLENNRSTASIYKGVFRSNELYNKLAKLKSDQTKQGAKLVMSQFEPSKAVEREVPRLKVPPITMAIDIRDDLDYGDVPIVVAFKPEITIPSGISAPKVITAVGSNAIRYRQLFKGGTDDLRQDAIMEQVFEQVTSLLKKNKATRQRNLGIRTYKVVPLDATSGAIQFVEPTMSLNDFLVDAHQRYNPKDLKWKACRDKMSDAADQDLQVRIEKFRSIKSRFSPVLRHFFFERFERPDEWFERRLAYTRSTAAISILGHILGLGDRHCQNILLDTQTGEVIHIDLGVAFEAGRILPKPETVPFRLTRDVVDGFGVLKTEGVFRRCCEFTLEALRQNKDTILTLLNVLRYDPLYSWSVSPLRAKRLQDEQESRIAGPTHGSVAQSRVISRHNSAAAQDGINEEAGLLKEKQREDEGGEADRALSTVQKKLSTGLSVSATVNELIQQATEDKNLAVLFHGWAPYA